MRNPAPTGRGHRPTEKQRAQHDAAGCVELDEQQLDSAAGGHFQRVDGLGMSLEVIEYQDGDDVITHRRPGRAP